MDFGDAVDGARSLHAHIWSWVPGRGGAERADGAGDEQTQTVLGCDVQDVVKPCRQRQEATLQLLLPCHLQTQKEVAVGLTGDVNRACQRHVGFSDGTEEGAVVEQPGDAIIHHDLSQVLVVQDVCIYERS